MSPAFTFYGVSYKEIEEACRDNNVKAEKRNIPRYCINKDEKERYQSERYQGSMSRSYDLEAGFCCYYTCLPDCSCSPSRRRRGSALDCGGGGGDCGDGDSDCGDAGAVVLVLVIIVAIIAVLIFAAPTVFAVGVVVFDLLLAGIVFLFDILTLGLFHRYLTRTQVFIDTDDDVTIGKIFYDVARKGGLPRAQGFWSEGFIGVRYGAVGTIVGIVVAVVTYFIDPSSNWWYLIPLTIIVVSIALLYTGTYNVKRRREEVMEAIASHFSEKSQ
ncbi:MAG: hypothetical protein ACXAEU_02430 [Candidatus Hodarchaeales archaeon]